jgi:hypothetical protein
MKKKMEVYKVEERNQIKGCTIGENFREDLAIFWKIICQVQG